MKQIVGRVITSDRTMVGLCDGRWPMPILGLSDGDGDADGDGGGHSLTFYNK